MQHGIMDEIVQFQTNIHTQREVENWGHYVASEDISLFIGDLED